MSTAEKININTFTLAQKKILMEKVYNTQSYFQTLFKQDYREFPAETAAVNFRNEIMRLLLNQQLIANPMLLEDIHEVLSDEMKAYNFIDGVNKISTFFYETDEHFAKTYHQFIAYLRQTIITEPFWFQATPTIRIHCPNGLNNHHYPRYHSDISYGHPPEEINIWFPLTELKQGHGFRALDVMQSKLQLEKFNYDFAALIQSAINDKSFSEECEQQAMAVTTAFGSFFAFDSRCIHSGEPLKQHTRVSMDIRILPLSQYEKMHIEYQGSGRRKIIFAPGHCYHPQHSDYFLS